MFRLSFKSVDILKRISIFLCIFWLAFIFYNSTQTGKDSNTTSFEVANKLRNEYKSIEGKSTSDYSTLPLSNKEKNINFFIRKNAHAFEYFVLSIFVSLVFFSFKFRGKAPIIYILFICLFYAVLDEFHQIYVPGRNSSVEDVLIDFLGSILGICTFYFIFYIILSKKERLN